ncbi:MAG: aldose 1-epimerase family protein [Flavihumibacter sp.]
MSDLVFLENDFLRAGIHPKGAELQLLESKKTGKSYLWKGDSAWWGKFSPVLFPIVGSLKANTYYYNGEAYTLPRHGFARDRFFMVDKTSAVAANFNLRDDADTRKVYPFSFSLDLYYQLVDDRLSLRYTVQNTGAGRSWFSIGAHPAFAVPPGGVESPRAFSDHYLEFDVSTSLHRYKLQDGLVSDQTEEISLPNGRLQLKPALFAADALVLKHLPDTRIILRADLHPYGIEFAWSDFPFFGIWQPAGAPFICLEPWCGVADQVHHNQDITRKEGIQSLAAGESFVREWSVRCF